MKYCDNCGKELKNKSIYCEECGKKQVEITDTNESLGTVSLVLGIISLVLVFFVNISIFPVALIGLIFGIICKSKTRKKNTGIILNSISLVLSIIIFIVFMIFIVFFAFIDEIANDHNYDWNNDYEYNYNYDYDNDNDYDKYDEEEIDYSNIVGTWNCKELTNIAKADYKYSVELKDDKTFILKNIEENKYLNGNYDFKDDGSKSPIKNFPYYIIEFNTENSDYEYKMIIASLGSKNASTLFDEQNDKVYYCNK